MPGNSDTSQHLGRDVVETGLPSLACQPQFLFCAKGISAFDELHGAFQGNLRARSDQQVEVVGHHHEFMQKIFVLCSIVVEHIYKQERRSFGLEQVLLAIGRCGDEVVDLLV
jgi:hypothetical protein